MRIQLIFILLCFSTGVLSDTDSEVKDLFAKYEAVMDRKKIELIEEVFSKKFLKENGGKKELISKIKRLPVPLLETSKDVSWKEGKKGKFYLARYKESSSNKMTAPKPESEFILVKEDGQLKIDGTISDGN